MAYVDSVYVDTGPKKNPNPKPVIEYLEFKNSGASRHRYRLEEVHQAYVNGFNRLTEFNSFTESNDLVYSFSISTVAGELEVTTTNPEVAKYLVSSYIDGKPFSLSANF